MKSFEYVDENITEREIMVAVISLTIGAGILNLPRTLAQQTNAADGLISIALAGGGVVIITWMLAKFCSKFPGKSLIDFGTRIVGKPMAISLTLMYGIIYLLQLSQVIRVTADVTKQYLLDKTPIEVTALSFLLVLVYAVSSSRVGLFRLNALFLPFITLVVFVLTGFSIPDFDLGNVQPLLTTGLSNYIEGIKNISLAFTGFSILFFYTALVKKPKNVPKAAAIGAVIPTVLYMVLFVVVIGVFNNSVTANLVYPTVELAKNVQIPGHIFARFESVFFVIWSMAIFNTGAMIFDVVVLALTSVFQKVKKIHMIFIITPLIYFIAMIPGTMYSVQILGEVVGYTVFIYVVSITLLLFITAKVRGMI